MLCTCLRKLQHTCVGRGRTCKPHNRSQSQKLNPQPSSYETTVLTPKHEKRTRTGQVNREHNVIDEIEWDGRLDDGERARAFRDPCELLLLRVCIYTRKCARACGCARVGVWDNDRLSPHGDVEPAALILIHYLYFPHFADCTYRTQHIHSKRAAEQDYCTRGPGSVQACAFSKEPEIIKYTSTNT